MSRTLSATISAAIALDDTKPVYLVRMGWSTPELACTWDVNISWNSETWEASGIEVSGIDSEGGQLVFPLGDADPWLDLVTGEGQRNKTVTVYEYQTNFAVSPAVADAVAIFVGIMDSATIGDDIKIDLIPDKRYKAFPPESVDQTVFTHLVPSGTVLIWRDTVITAE